MKDTNMPTTPRIVSPNLGCPEVVSPGSLDSTGVNVVIAVGEHEIPSASVYSLWAVPCRSGDGKEFELAIADSERLEDDSLPNEFSDVADTRKVLSTLLRRKLLSNCSFWYTKARPKQTGNDRLRRVAGSARATLYDLSLRRAGTGDELCRVHHALCLRAANADVKFIHLTDLHVAARNDLWAEEVPALVTQSNLPSKYVNFNDNLRTFIRHANKAADEGRLDLVLALGDLVDFVRLGVTERSAGDNNWTTFIQILTGTGDEPRHDNEGLRVPVFTTSGNHDWRPYPYPPEVNCAIFGMSKQCALELDYWYHDTSEEVGNKIKTVQETLVREGSPILRRSWWGSVTTMGVRGLIVGVTRFFTRAKAIGGDYSRHVLWLFAASIFGRGLAGAIFPGAATDRNWAWLLSGGILALIASILGPRVFYNWLRKTIEKLVAIETDLTGLSEYFLNINPFFNYAFRLENCYFLVLDTGHDCLTAESFWDEGAKKIGPISVDDNILGGSPDTMAFYPANENYPYSQIAWMEAVLARISKNHGGLLAGDPRTCRIFIGLHTPPANLSKKDRANADKQLTSGKDLFLIPPSGGGLAAGRLAGRYDIRYGTVNHYLSQFFYLCLGYREAHLGPTPTGPGVDAVFAGHAHWSIEFRLQRPQGAHCTWDPEVFYGHFSTEVEGNCGDSSQWWGPLFLQTGACGVPSATDPNCPNFRYVTVSPTMAVCNLRPRTLANWGAHLTAAAAGKNR
ncbi:MAG: metallophosphoesterase [Terriglobales bacterium]